MRIIDADALARKWQDVLNEKADEKGTVAYITFELFLERLAQEPTLTLDDIIPHGRWRYKWDAEKDPKRLFVRIVCSECNLHTGQTSNFCPNCGAKMDLEEE